MVSDINDNLFEDSSDINSTEHADNMSLKGVSLAEKKAQEQAQKNLLARKRIDELQEKRRLKDLLDDSEDW
ncbi:PA3496 family putative envelope integrity protein [Colwellia psychrerythraea]|uniref:Uncharacterized protein n=1 Tax=Colwellia psychrerythraea TaxID=28229 RepID=A0A099KJX6_COLPS|nr:hypothetical protein [Colwellia psychrerythraea]KGJ90560.1 hypothetical protein GAB14E_3560 [Colwellia psychrerythraea]